MGKSEKFDRVEPADRIRGFVANPSLIGPEFMDFVDPEVMQQVIAGFAPVIDKQIKETKSTNNNENKQLQNN